MLYIMLIFERFPFISLPISLGKTFLTIKVTFDHILAFIGHNSNTKLLFQEENIYFPL